MAEPSREVGPGKTGADAASEQNTADKSLKSALSPAVLKETEALLDAFRTWLVETERRTQANRGFGGIDREKGSSISPPESPTVDLHSLCAEMATLRREVQIESRAGKQSRESLDSARDGFTEGLRGIREALREELSGGFDKVSRELQEREAANLAEEAEIAAITQLLDIREVLERGTRISTDVRRYLRWRKVLLPAALFDRLAEGSDLGLRKLDEWLRQRGVERVESVGKCFDPECMKAVETAPLSDGEEGRVVEEIRMGYRWKDRVIRYCEVKVRAVRIDHDPDQ